MKLQEIRKNRCALARSIKESYHNAKSAVENISEEIIYSIINFATPEACISYIDVYRDRIEIELFNESESIDNIPSNIVKLYNKENFCFEIQLNNTLNFTEFIEYISFDTRDNSVFFGIEEENLPFDPEERSYYHAVFGEESDYDSISLAFIVKDENFFN